MSEPKPEYKIDGRPPTIFRTVKDKDNPYAMVDMRPILNCTMSWKAKGILVYLLSRPDGWEINLVDLTNRSTDGIASVKAGVRELKGAGHLKHAGIRKTSGQFDTVIWEVYEAPQVGNQLTDSPQMGVVSPQVENPPAVFPPADNHMQVVLSTLSNNELINCEKSEKPQYRKPDMLDGMIHYANLADEKTSWSGREKMPEPIRDLLDFYVQLTGQKPLKDQIMDWLSTGNDWIEAGIKTIDLQSAYNKSKPDANGKGGFMVNRPGSLTRTAQMFAGERQVNKTGMKSGDRALAEIAEMINGK